MGHTRILRKTLRHFPSGVRKLLRQNNPGCRTKRSTRGYVPFSPPGCSRRRRARILAASHPRFGARIAIHTPPGCSRRRRARILAGGERATASHPRFGLLRKPHPGWGPRMGCEDCNSHSSCLAAYRSFLIWTVTFNADAPFRRALYSALIIVSSFRDYGGLYGRNPGSWHQSLSTARRQR